MTDLSQISTSERRKQVAALGRLLGWYRGFIEARLERGDVFGVPSRDAEAVEQLYRDLIELVIEKGIIS